ncbi:hypothetical protein C8R46DRAFT_840141, partial [Mycena filopes]
PPPSLGGILGCGAMMIEAESKAKPSGVNRLFRILITESAYLIWLLRNERVIVRDGVPHSEQEIHNRWVHKINDRLEVDQYLANQITQPGKKLVTPSLVLQTWSDVLLDEAKLPKDWLREPKVLVGIVSR